MIPTGRQQPYRKSRPREPGAALTAMLRGRTAGGYDSADITRAAQRLAAAGKRGRRRRKRPPRLARPARPPR